MYCTTVSNKVVLIKRKSTLYTDALTFIITCMNNNTTAILLIHEIHEITFLVVNGIPYTLLM